MDQALVPSATDVLCESCGYNLNGLPESGRCPECGAPIADSTTASPRTLPPWEADLARPAARFACTALRVVWSPSRFFRTLSIHGDVRRSRRFGLLMLVPLVVFSSKTILLHQFIAVAFGATPLLMNPMAMIPLVPVAVLTAWLIVYWSVARLTALEAKYWGYRLHLDVVRRALHYLAAQAAAATLLPLAVVWIYLLLLVADETFALYMPEYLYAFSGAVIVAAVYLFRVYWTAMRSLLYANR